MPNAQMVLVLLVMLLTGCATSSPNSPNPYACESADDCSIKDVHNCCGYYPRCVNKDFVPDIEAVVRTCIGKDVMSVCGFPEITHCACVHNSCKSMQDDREV